MCVGGQRHASTALLLGKIPGTHCTAVCVGPMAGLDRYRKSRLSRGSIPGLSSLYRVAMPAHAQLSLLLLLLLLLLSLFLVTGFLPCTSLEPAVTPTAQASEFHTAVLSVLCEMFQV
jgi:hypothetical protein